MIWARRAGFVVLTVAVVVSHPVAALRSLIGVWREFRMDQL